MRTAFYVLFCLALTSVCCGQSVSQLHDQFKTARSNQAKDAAIGKLFSISSIRPTERDRAALRKVAIELAADAEPNVRKVACNILANVADKSCAPTVNALLADTVPAVASMAVRVSLKANDVDTVDALGKFITEHGTPTTYVQGNPAEALAAIGTKEARAKLLEIHGSTKDKGVKEQVGRALDAMDARGKR